MLDEIVVDLANISPYHWLFVCFVSLVLRYAAKEVLAGVALLKEEQETTMEWLPDVPDLYNPEVDSSNADAAGGSRRRLGRFRLLSGFVRILSRFRLNAFPQRAAQIGG